MTGKVCKNCGFSVSAYTPDATSLPVGSILMGKYIIGKVIGKGGFGITYAAYDSKAEKIVAIKEYYPNGTAYRSGDHTTVSVTDNKESGDLFKLGVEKFYEEAKLVSRFNGNPNIVSVFEFFYENDTAYFSMEYLRGITLKEYLEKTGRLTREQTLFIARNLCNALMAAHSAGVLHRDISPDNVMLCNNGDVKLLDFGAARQYIGAESKSLSVILKQGFAPLEQYQKKGRQGPWTDIYSLGATLYYAVTMDILDDPMSRLDDDGEYQRNKHNIDGALWEIIKKCTELKIENRYNDIFQLSAELNEIEYEAVPVVIAEKPPIFRRQLCRRPPRLRKPREKAEKSL